MTGLAGRALEMGSYKTQCLGWDVPTELRSRGARSTQKLPPGASKWLQAAVAKRETE